MHSWSCVRAVGAIAVGLVLGFPSLALDDSTRDLMEQGLALHESGDYDGAIAVYSRILAIHPENSSALYEMAFSTYAKGDFPNAIVRAEKALASEPRTRPGLYVFLGSSHGMLGDWAKGETILRRGLEIWPEDAPLHFNLGVSLEAQGQLEAAASQFEEALRRSPYQAGGWRVLADILDRAGRKGRAFAAYARSLTLEKGSEASERAARRLREMVFEGAQVVDGKGSDSELRIGVQVPQGAEGDTFSRAATESVGIGLVSSLRYKGEWKGKSDSRFFVYAVDQVLKLLSAMQVDGDDQGGPFWGPLVFSYFDEGRKAGHMEAIAYDLHSTSDLEALRWRREHGDQEKRYRDWSDRWAVDWSVAR